MWYKACAIHLEPFILHGGVFKKYFTISSIQSKYQDVIIILIVF